MKVLHIIDTFLTPTMTFIYNEVTDLQNHVEVTVCCSNRIESEKYPFRNVECINTGFLLERAVNFLKRKTLEKKNNYWPSAAKEFRRVIEKEKPDIIHCQFGTTLIFFKSHFSCNIPVFVSYHGFDASACLEDKNYVDNTNLFLDKNTYPIFVSNDMLNRFRNKGINFHNEMVLYYGTNIDFFNRTNWIAPKIFTFLQISSFTEKKGHIYTLKAFAKLISKLKGKKQVKLILGGDGPLKQQIIKEIDELAINDYVELPGLLNNDLVKEQMENASCFIHHSVTSSRGSKEGIPNVIMEAMAMNLPVISTYHSGIPELVEDGINGFLVEEKNVKSYSERMLEIMDWNYLKINRDKINMQFERKKRTAQLVKFYNQVLLDG